MEEALILGKISYRVSKKMIEELRKIDGVIEAALIFGPYDFYATVKTETKEEMGDIIYKVRSIDGVLDSLTCNVVSFSDIRPTASGPGIE